MVFIQGCILTSLTSEQFYTRSFCTVFLSEVHTLLMEGSLVNPFLWNCQLLDHIQLFFYRRRHKSHGNYSEVNKQVWLWPQKALGMCGQEPCVLLLLFLLLLLPLLLFLFLVSFLSCISYGSLVHCYLIRNLDFDNFWHFFDRPTTDRPTDRPTNRPTDRRRET